MGCVFTALHANISDSVGVLLEMEAPFNRPVAKTLVVSFIQG